VSDTAPRLLTYPMWLGVASFTWAIIGWLGAAIAPQLAFTPGIEVFHRVMPAVTLTLILINLLYALVAVFRRKVPVEKLLVVTALQLGLFTTLFFQLDAHFEANLFWIESPTESWKWVEFSAAHALRASDILDTVEAFDLKIQFIKHRSPLVAGLIVLYHLVVDLFMLGLFRAIAGKVWSRLMEDPELKEAVFLIGKILFGLWLIVWLACVMHYRPWNLIDIPIWLSENVLRVFDFPDIMDSYDIHWHQVPKEPLESTLTFLCRVWIVVGIAWFLNWRTSHTHVQPLPALAPVSLSRLWPLLLVPAVQIAAVLVIDQYRQQQSETVASELIAQTIGADSEKSEKALAAIRRLGPNLPQGIEPLVTGCSRSPQRKAAIIETLGLLGPQAIQTLGNLATEPNADESNVDTTVTSLVAIGPKSAPALVAMWSQTPFLAIKDRIDSELRDMGTDAVRPLISATTAENSENHLFWFKVLDRNWELRDPRGNEVFDSLRQILDHVRELQDSNQKVRFSAALALGNIGPAAKDSVPALIDALKSNAGGLRQTAASALEKIGPAAVPALIDALKGKDEELRQVAALALGNIGPAAKDSVPALIGAVKDKEGKVRMAAADALYKMGPAAVPALLDALKGKDEEVRQAAAAVLGKIGAAAKDSVPALIDALKGKDEELRQAAAAGLVKMGPAAVPALIEALKDKGWWVRLTATAALGQIGPSAKEAVPGLIEALKDENRDWRSAVAAALGNIGPDAKDAVPALINVLKDTDWSVRKAAAEALGNIGPDAKDAVPALINVLKGMDWSVRSAAAAALGRIGPAAKDALPALRDALKDQENKFRLAAEQALERIETK
jgi:HEAT repeat protein